MPLSPVMAQRSVEKVAAPATRKQAGAVKVEADHRSAGVPSTTSPAGPSPQDRPQEDPARGAVVEVMTRLTAGESEPTGAPDGDPGGTQAEENEVEGTSNQFASDQAEPGEDDEAVEAKREFWSKLPQESYLKMIRRELSPRAVDRFGLRANVPENEAILRMLAEKHGVRTMLRAGLYCYPKRDGQESVVDDPLPNSQFHGYGLANRKTGEWGRTNPTIIPYFDELGKVVELRPHKGGIRAGWTAHSVAPRLYMATGRDQTPPRDVDIAVLTEGEFKAMAVASLFDDYGVRKGRYAVAALPGIQMTGRHPVQNHYVWEGLLQWLRQVNPQLVVVVFDNEDKANPSLPGYKANPWLRHEAPVWTLLTARKLIRAGYHALAGSLPDEWRDETGKADWDGGIVKCVHQLIRGEEQQ